MHVLLKLVEPHLVLMMFVWVYCLVGNFYVGYRDGGRAYVGFASIMFLIVGILALVSWIILLFS